MLAPLRPTILACAASMLALVLTTATSATAAAEQRLLSTAAPFEQPMSDTDMRTLRGGAGLLGLPSGSSAFVQIGATTQSAFQAASPSSASSALTVGGSSLKAAATLGAAPSPSPLSISRSFAQTYSLTTTRTFAASYNLGL